MNVDVAKQVFSIYHGVKRSIKLDLILIERNLAIYTLVYKELQQHNQDLVEKIEKLTPFDGGDELLISRQDVLKIIKEEK